MLWNIKKWTGKWLFNLLTIFTNMESKLMSGLVLHFMKCIISSFGVMSSMILSETKAKMVDSNEVETGVWSTWTLGGKRSLTWLLFKNTFFLFLSYWSWHFKSPKLKLPCPSKSIKLVQIILLLFCLFQLDPTSKFETNWNGFQNPNDVANFDRPKQNWSNFVFINQNCINLLMKPWIPLGVMSGLIKDLNFLH